MTAQQPTLEQAISLIEAHIENANIGLPFPVFELISRLTPMVNVDLLIKDKNNRVLLAWRDDEFAGQGWHIPGGIVRFKETLDKRIQQVALREIGQPVSFNPEPLTMNEVICTHETRGHFISLLYDCMIEAEFEPDNSTLSPTDPGYLVWHEHCPENLVRVHEMYRHYIVSRVKK